MITGINLFCLRKKMIEKNDEENKEPLFEKARCLFQFVALPEIIFSALALIACITLSIKSNLFSDSNSVKIGCFIGIGVAGLEFLGASVLFAIYCKQNKKGNYQ